MRFDCDALVIGAGISGLVAARKLERGGAHVRVIDAGMRAGGVIGTRQRDGFLYELGPNSTLDTTPLINALLDDTGIRGERVEASSASSRRFIIRDGKPVVLPTSPGAFLRTRAFSTMAKLRLAREPFIAPAAPDAEESIAAFVRRRLGREFLDYAIDPFVAGIYAGNPEEISVPAAFPRLHSLEQRYGSLIKGQIKGRRERARSGEPAKNSAGSFSFRGGMQVLPEAIARALREVAYATTATSIERIDGAFAVSFQGPDGAGRIHARSVIVAVPAYAASGLCAGIAPAAADALHAIEYAPVASLVTAYRRADVQHALDGFGFLVPRVEHRRILGTLFSSSMFPGRAPDDSVLLTTFAGGRRDPGIAALSDDELAAIVAEELRALVGAPHRPSWHVVTRWAKAIPQYTLGHLERLRPLEDAEARLPGLFFCASYRGGVAVGDCIKSGTAAGERAATHLAQRQQSLVTP